MANLNAIKPEASLIRLSPSTIVETREGIASREVTALTATASVGEITAPSANAAASGRSGTSQCIKYPTTSTVRKTSPKASSSTGRITLSRSRLGISQPSAKSSGGMKRRKKMSGSIESERKPGRYDRHTPPATSKTGSGAPVHFPMAATAATASSRARVISIRSMDGC
jgi:hypothetical protein